MTTKTKPKEQVTEVEEPWEVTLFPDEKAFIDEVFKRKITTDDIKGAYIAPLRGGIIYLDENYGEYTEAQQKWLVLNELLNPDRLHSGFKGMKFMNFNYNGVLPEIGVDPEAEDKWGTKRMTTKGQPVNEQGYPIEFVQKTISHYKQYAWEPTSKEYVCCKEEENVASIIDNSGVSVPAPDKMVD